MAYAGDLKSLAARIVGSSPTAPTIWSFRARVPKGCGLVSFRCRWDSKLRWNSSCLCCLPAYLGTISPQLRLILPHFSMEKRDCLPHFPREMRIWPYIILRLGERALRSAQPLHKRSFVFCGVCGVGEVEMKRNAFLRRCRFRIVVHVRPPSPSADLSS